MTDDDFLSELRIVPFDTSTVKRTAKEEFFVRRLGEIEREVRGLGWIPAGTIITDDLLSRMWDRFVQENGSVLDD